MIVEHEKLSAQVSAQSWVVLVLQDEKYNGLFRVAWVRPDIAELPNIIVKSTCRTSREAMKETRKMLSGGSIDKPLNLFCKTLESKLSKRFGHLVPIEVIDHSAFFSRAKAGEFKLKLRPEQEMQRLKTRLRYIQGPVKFHIPCEAPARKAKPVIEEAPSIPEPIIEKFIPTPTPEPVVECLHPTPLVPRSPSPTEHDFGWLIL